jgi:hypothetical protein
MKMGGRLAALLFYPALLCSFFTLGRGEQFGCGAIECLDV